MVGEHTLYYFSSFKFIETFYDLHMVTLESVVCVLEKSVLHC